SGDPRNTLGRNASYGPQATYILPAGSAGRTDMQASLDLRAVYDRELADYNHLEITLDLFNLLDTQGELATDDEYTTDVVDAIAGGSRADLPYLRQTSAGVHPGALATRKLDFGNTTLRAAPLSARIGAKFSF